MAIRISRSLLDRLLTQAAASPDAEICGLLFGTDDCIAEARATDNVAADPAFRFEIDPAALIAAHRRARAGGPRIIGCFHSHPAGSARPSAQDAADAAADGMLWMIVARGGATLWRAGTGELHGRFQAEALVAVEP